MQTIRLAFVSFLVLAAGQAAATPIQLRASDGVKLYGEFTPVKNPRGVFLLVHSMYDNRRSYDYVARRLAQEGYASVALDQRVGMDNMGLPNVTVRGVPPGKYDIHDVMKDVEAAYAFARKQYPKAHLYAFGEGDGASLLFAFAVKHPELAGLIAFGPNYQGRGELDFPLLKLARQVRMSVLLIADRDPTDLNWEKRVLAALPAGHKQLFVPKLIPGVDGVQNLDPELNIVRGSSQEFWDAVLKFLRRT